MADCDFIIEAVLENLEIKQGIYKQLDEICKESTIIASNTSVSPSRNWHLLSAKAEKASSLELTSTHRPVS